MIIDTLDNIDFYFGISKELDAALSVLKHYNLSMLKAGEYYDFPVSGSGILLKILEPSQVNEDDNIPWEYHKSCIDIMCVLKGGNELIGYAPRRNLVGWEYDESNDVAYTSEAYDYLPIRMGENDFAVFFPQDAHRKVENASLNGYRKLLFKVPIFDKRLSKTDITSI